MPWPRRLARHAAVFALLPLGLVLLGMAACQGRLIHPGQRYAQAMWEKLLPGIEPIRFRTEQGEQVSFYRPPTSGAPPERLWLVCSGNGGYALQWPDLLATARDPQAGYLLLDYPGYGFSEGSSSPARILAATEGAVEALRLHLGLDAHGLAQRLSLLGHSLGAAAALQYAARHEVQRLVLAAPFTTMVDMGHHMLFWPCGQLIWHRYDNIAHLALVAARQPRPEVLVLHGGADRMIPPEMSERLVAPYAGWVRRVVVPNIDHDMIAIDAVTALRPTAGR